MIEAPPPPVLAAMTDPVNDEDTLHGLKTKRAWSDKREPFSPSDINDPDKRARMQASSGMWDDDLNELKVVPKGQRSNNRAATRAHFKLKSGIPRTPIHRDSADVTHNNAVDDLHGHLAVGTSSLSLVSKGWDSNNKPTKTTLWKQHPLSDYSWHKEPGTRLLMECQDFIQPDIVGVDSTRMNRTAANPGIIIEVVHHHWPDETTFKHLKSLSALRYIVAFYFVKQGFKNNNFVNTFHAEELHCSLTAGTFLFGGTFFHNGKELTESADPVVDYHKFKNIAMDAAKESFAAQARRSEKR